MDDGAVSHRSLGLLLSEAVDREYGTLFDAVATQSGVRLRRWTAPRGPAELASIDLAFFSRELYEGSTLRQPGPLSDAFFRMADAAPNLKWLHVCSSGLDLPQYAAALARGVRLTGSSGSTAVPIAHNVLAAVLAQSRGFGHWLAAQRERAWRPLTGAARPREIAGQRAVVVGAGPIGSEIGRLLAGVGFHTIAVRRTVLPTPHFAETVPLAALDTVLPACDWLILALPLTDKTYGLIDARRLSLLPPRARLANVARGELVDEVALVEALHGGRLAGAYLDAFATEPLPACSPLWSQPDVWITPHNSSASQGHERRVVDRFLAELKTWLGEHA
jgi:phosphoglycerate dehydrogenase-like enzyme